MKTHGVIRFGAIAWILCASLASAMAVTFTQDTSISFSDLSYEGADIVITNCTLTVDGSHIFHSLLVQNGGVLTHSPNSNGPQQFTFFVSNEPHVTSATNPTTLGNINVDTSTITVLNTARTTIYTAGVDYVITSLGQAVQLTLTTNSAIAEGAIVSVNYDWMESVQGFTLYLNNGAIVEAGGAINVSGKGYAGGIGANNGAGGNQATNFPFTFRAGVADMAARAAPVPRSLAAARVMIRRSIPRASAAAAERVPALAAWAAVRRPFSSAEIFKSTV
jgi:hypothetical protein